MPCANGAAWGIDIHRRRTIRRCVVVVGIPFDTSASTGSSPAANPDRAPALVTSRGFAPPLRKTTWRGVDSPISTPDEFVYDSPHMFGTKRTGPDLSRFSLEELANLEISSVSKRPEALSEAAASVS